MNSDNRVSYKTIENFLRQCLHFNRKKLLLRKNAFNSLRNHNMTQIFLKKPSNIIENQNKLIFLD